ncbi:MAG: N-acetylmuramoyl-L-alanine amidase family protein [Candidatus Omnitrophota bacterium]
MKQLAIFAFLFVWIPLSLFPLSVNIRVYDHPGYTRVVLQGEKAFEYSYTPNRTGMEIRLNRKVDVKTTIETFKHSMLIDHVAHSVEKSGKKGAISVFNVYTRKGITVKNAFVLEQPFRVVFDVEKNREKNADAATATPAPPATQHPVTPPQPSGDKEKQDKERDKKRSMITTICLDPGHGGNDQGAVGRSKIQEKDITLKVVGKLKKIIETKLGLYVVTTRDKDEDVSLNSRVARANNQKAQLFVSIHVNSSFRKAASGSETFYVSLKATDQESLQLSRKENDESAPVAEAIEAKEKEKLPVETSNELKMILWNMAQTEYIKESSVLADYIQAELNILLDTANRGVKQAPFRVLMRAAMPAVLVEIVFISNPAEEKKLQTDEFLNNVANAIYTGINKFITATNNK